MKRGNEENEAVVLYLVLRYSLLKLKRHSYQSLSSLKNEQSTCTWLFALPKMCIRRQYFELDCCFSKPYR